MKHILDTINSSDQTGFIPGRYIGENTRIIYDLMQFTEERNIPRLLLMIDFEKAFDSVSCQYIDKALNVFNFGPSIRRWISVFQYETISAITHQDFCHFLLN